MEPRVVKFLWVVVLIVMIISVFFTSYKTLIRKDFTILSETEN